VICERFFADGDSVSGHGMTAFRSGMTHHCGRRSWIKFRM